MSKFGQRFFSFIQTIKRSEESFYCLHDSSFTSKWNTNQTIVCSHIWKCILLSMGIYFSNGMNALKLMKLHEDNTAQQSCINAPMTVWRLERCFIISLKFQKRMSIFDWSSTTCSICSKASFIIWISLIAVWQKYLVHKIMVTT